MQIVQRKSKDAELAETVFVELQQVTIPAWYDEDNQPVTSAVIVQAQTPNVIKKESKFSSEIRVLENAWWATQAETR